MAKIEGIPMGQASPAALETPARRRLWRAMMRAGAARSGRRHVSRGQALVEFALFIPLLLFMLVGATDVSTLLNDHLNVVYATRTSVRVGATLDTAPNADCAVVGALQAALANNHDLTVNQIVIFKADSSGNPITTNEDVYAGNTVCNADGSTTPAALSLGWPPSQRVTTPFKEDSLGVEVDFTYTYTFNVFGFAQLPPTYDRAVSPMEVVVSS